MTGICDEEASYHRSTIAVLQPRYQATPILQQSVGGDRSGGLHFSSLLGAKPTSVETPKMTFLTQGDIPAGSFVVLHNAAANGRLSPKEAVHEATGFHHLRRGRGGGMAAYRAESATN